MKTSNLPNFSHWTSLATLCGLASALLLCSPAIVNAEEPAQKAPAKGEKVKAPAKAAKVTKVKTPVKTPTTTPKVVVTGSRIPVQVKSTGNIRETASPVYLVDRKEIERSGAMTVADVLRRLPFVR